MMIQHPQLPQVIKIIKREDKYIIINPNLPRWIVTNELGNVLLTLFDGTRAVEEIVSLAVDGLGEQMRGDVEKFCRQVLASGILVDARPQPKQHPMRLSSVHLSLSDGCNLNCIYCYARERKEKQYPKLSFEEYTAIINDILTINPNVTITLTGGEPLLNKHCFDIAHYIKEKGAQTLLLSNGTLFSRQNIGQIADNFDLVTLSIDGPNEHIHSLTRGDNYQKVIHATQLMDEFGINYTLSMTVTKKNIGYVEEMAKMFGSRLNFAPYFPISGEPSDLAITGEEYYQALKSASGVNPLSYCENILDGSQSSRSHKCAIGDGEFSISATGDVYPCQLLHTDDFYAGNVHDQSIRDIYYNAQSMKRCASLDVVTIEGCRDCAIKFICGGSCRARAYYEGGNIQSSSEFCKYEQEAFYDGIIQIYSQNLLTRK